MPEYHLVSAPANLQANNGAGSHRNQGASQWNNREPQVTKTINLIDAFKEYVRNAEFRKIMNSGAVCYAEGSFVLNDPRYIDQSQSPLKLTPYAKSHINECALTFVLRKDYPHENGVLFRVDRKKLKDAPRYETGMNDPSVLDGLEEYQQLVKRFEKEYSDYASITPTFLELANKLIDNKKWKTKDFTDETYLSSATFHRIRTNDPHDPSLRTITMLCVGLNTNWDIAKKLVAAAGLTWKNTKECYAYYFILRYMKACR